MTCRVFYSFHYALDAFRVAKIRNIEAFEDNPEVSDQDWEDVKKGGDEAIKKWIHEQMAGRTCLIVLIGKETYKRKWIKYEIREAWRRKMGIVGIYINGIKDENQETCEAGEDPFESISIKGRSLSSIVTCFTPIGKSSDERYNWIKNNMNWIVLWGRDDCEPYQL